MGGKISEGAEAANEKMGEERERASEACVGPPAAAQVNLAGASRVNIGQDGRRGLGTLLGGR